jgi:hypothetical protein
MLPSSSHLLPPLPFPPFFLLGFASPSNPSHSSTSSAAAAGGPGPSTMAFRAGGPSSTGSSSFFSVFSFLSPFSPLSRPSRSQSGLCSIVGPVRYPSGGEPAPIEQSTEVKTTSCRGIPCQFFLTTHADLFSPSASPLPLAAFNSLSPSLLHSSWLLQLLLMLLPPPPAPVSPPPPTPLLRTPTLPTPTPPLPSPSRPRVPTPSTRWLPSLSRRGASVSPVGNGLGERRRSWDRLLALFRLVAVFQLAEQAVLLMTRLLLVRFSSLFLPFSITDSIRSVAIPPSHRRRYLYCRPRWHPFLPALVLYVTMPPLFPFRSRFVPSFGLPRCPPLSLSRADPSSSRSRSQPVYHSRSATRRHSLSFP